MVMSDGTAWSGLGRLNSLVSKIGVADALGGLVDDADDAGARDGVEVDGHVVVREVDDFDWHAPRVGGAGRYVRMDPGSG